MPFCNISKDVSLHYITNTPRGDATDLDLTKATIIMIPPPFCDVMWLREQFKDPRLSQDYNLIGIDQRNMGLTQAPLSPDRDSWVDAADVAVVHEILQLPPCHLFTVAMNSGSAALRFAALFPEKCLSLCLCAAPVQAGEDPPWVEQGYQEMTQAWCFPQDLETLERACMEFGWYAFNGQISPELQDELVAWWQVNMPPTKRSIFLAQALCALHRSRLSDEELGSIKQPTLLIQGDKSLINPPHKAQELSTKLPDARVFVVQEYASITNRVYCRFLRRLPQPPASQPSQPDPSGVCKIGLERLAVFAGDTTIAGRDPSSVLSFSRLSPEVIEQNQAMFVEFAKGETEAFHALNENGHPMRKFSERHVDQWTLAAFAEMKKHRDLGVTVVETASFE